MENKLYEGIRIKVWKLQTSFLENDKQYAGGYSIIRVDMFGEKLIKEISGGEPFLYAYRDAEELAILLDAELKLNDEIIRMSIKGIYK
jgi:hypothetical protein